VIEPFTRTRPLRMMASAFEREQNPSFESARASPTGFSVATTGSS
jgi:hypothetical protein